MLFFEFKTFSANNEYLWRGQLHVEIFKRGYAWLDTGDSMLEPRASSARSRRVRDYKSHAFRRIAYENGWMTKNDIRESVKDVLKNEYVQYHLRLT